MPVGIDPDKRKLIEQLVINAATESCQPVRRNQILAGFLRHYVSPVTSGAYMEAIGEGFLNLVHASERLSGRRPLREEIGASTKLTIYAALQAHRS